MPIYGANGAAMATFDASKAKRELGWTLKVKAASGDHDGGGASSSSTLAEGEQVVSAQVMTYVYDRRRQIKD